VTKKLEEEEAALMHRLNTTMQKEKTTIQHLIKLNEQSPVLANPIKDFHKPY